MKVISTRSICIDANVTVETDGTHYYLCASGFHQRIDWKNREASKYCASTLFWKAGQKIVYHAPGFAPKIYTIKRCESPLLTDIGHKWRIWVENGKELDIDYCFKII